MKAINSKGKVIPFAQNASFYMKRGAKEMEKNDLLTALKRYRQAYLSAPEDTEPCMAVAEILSQMQRFEESNRILLLLLSTGEGSPECFFGLACNYFGMHEYDYAAESLENYLDADPDGPFALEAEDFLDMIDDDDAMFEMTGLRTDEDYDDSASCLFARHLIDAGDYGDAVAELQHQMQTSPDSIMVQNQLVIAYFCNGEKEKAAALTRKILQREPDNILALCNMALLLHQSGDDAGAEEHLELANRREADAPEELHNISLIQMELGKFDQAVITLKKLLQQTPYDEAALHRLGYCSFMLGDREAATDCYKRLLTIHPEDTIAKYYLAQSKRQDTDERVKRGHWSVAYQVPFSEMFRRLNQLNRMLADTHEETLRLWREDEHFRQLLLWGLYLPEARVKKSMLSLIYMMGDAAAERYLRDFLLHSDQPDDLKRVVFGMLKQMGAKEPYMAYLNGQWIQGRVNMLEFSYKLPPAYEAVVQILLQCMVGTCSEECVTAAAGIYHRYIESLRENFPRITAAQETAFAAALEYLGCAAGGYPVPEEEIGRKYRISMTRLHNAQKKLEPFTEEPK